MNQFRYQPTTILQKQQQGELSQAVRYHQAGNLRGALTIYRQILEHDPGNAEALHLCGVLAYQLGQFDVAVNLIRKVTLNNPLVPEFHNDLGLVLKNKGKLNAATQCFQKALRLKPNFAEAHFNLGRTFISQRKFIAALEHLQKARWLKPNDPEVYLHLGIALINQGQPSPAFRSLQEALRLKPDFADAYYYLGFLLHSQNKSEAAIQQYEKVLHLKPHYEEASLNLSAARRRISPIQRRFIMNLCLLYDSGEEDQRCLNVLGKYLMDQAPNLGFYGAGRLCRYMFARIPELKSAVKFIIEDNPSGQCMDIEGIPVNSLENLPESVRTLFLCSTHYFAVMEMRKKLKQVDPDIKTCTLAVIKELDQSVIPPRAWKQISTIYPIDIPYIEFLPGQDMILLDLPARSISQMPAGFAFVHNALKQTGIKFQTVDLDNIIYHRYHSRRILDGLPEVRTASGYVLPEDPWQPVHYLEWENQELIEFFRPDIEEMVSSLLKAQPKIIGFSLQQANIHFAKEIITSVRKGLPNVIIVVGGMSCLQPLAAKMVMPEADYTVVGEADMIIGSLVKALVQGERPFNLPGVWSRFDTPNREFTPGLQVQDLDSLDHPRYEWTNIQLYRNWNGYQLTPIIASRGCHWARCRFCGERFHWRSRSPERVVDELEWLYKQGFNNFVFNDSDLHGDPKIIERIAEEIIQRDMKISMTAQLRCHSRVNKEYFKKLRSAGFTCLRFGVDGGSTNTLRLERKGYTKEVIRKNLRDSAKAGIFNEVNLVIGIPGETEGDIEETIAFFRELKPYIGSLAYINPLMLFRGSDYWDHPEEYGIHFRSDKEELYRKYLVAIPDDQWYSTDPYIDKEVRYSRLKRVVNALRKIGMPMGGFANFTVERIEDQYGDIASSNNPTTGWKPPTKPIPAPKEEVYNGLISSLMMAPTTLCLKPWELST